VEDRRGITLEIKQSPSARQDERREGKSIYEGINRWAYEKLTMIAKFALKQTLRWCSFRIGSSCGRILDSGMIEDRFTNNNGGAWEFWKRGTPDHFAGAPFVCFSLTTSTSPL